MALRIEVTCRVCYQTYKVKTAPNGPFTCSKPACTKTPRTRIEVYPDVRQNGLGQPCEGFYVHDSGIAIGCAYETPEQASTAAIAYRRDLGSQLEVL
jgi:hypothetical protein